MSRKVSTEVVRSRDGGPDAGAMPLVKRTGRGSVHDELVLADDWDSPETNAAMAAAFEREPEIPT
jgi:hypothetical protein